MSQVNEIIFGDKIENLKDKEQNPNLPKNLDIFQHLKLNIKKNSDNCKCQNTTQYYCIPCKVSVCEKCDLEDHKKHLLINKNNFELTDSNIDKIFKPLESYISSKPILTNPEVTKKSLINKIDEFVKELNSKAQRFQEAKYKEVEKLFSNFNNSNTIMQNSTKSTKEKLKNYLERNKKFFNFPEQPVADSKTYNLDEDNTYFLINYDIVNLVYQKSKEIASITETLEEDLKLYTEEQNDKLSKMNSEIENILFPLDTNANYASSNFTEPQSKNDSKRISIRSASKKDSNQDTASKKQQITVSKSAVKRQMFQDNSFDLGSPQIHFAEVCEELGEDHFEPINARINKYNNQIESFKRGVFNAYSKYGSYKEIERLVNVYERTKQKGAEGLFSEKKQGRDKKDEVIFYSKTKLNNKEDICLNNPLLEKYFSYLTMEMYGKNFRMATKELQSSHADLLIKVNEDEEVDFGKAIEGTNEIQIFDKKRTKLSKKVVKLTKNPFGYTKFPIGCRSLLIGDKLYIIGGKDEQCEYQNVLIYDRSKNKIKRIMDLREPRSYHTMVFNDVFDTIMVIGGENKASVEIFDPLTNRWQLLPELNVPRAGANFYFDKPRGIMYVMFGVEGLFTNGKYTDVIEYLDLSQFKKGWQILDYKNKSETDLKAHLNIYPLNQDLLLLYGGVTFRSSAKTVCILNIAKKEVNKIDPKLLEALRIESKKSRRLSSIVSGLSLNPKN